MSAVTLQVKGIEKLRSQLAQLPGMVRGGVKLVGPATAYGILWEYGFDGTGRVKKPGPKTLWSTNADGERRILTLTAPHGWIRINKFRYLELLHDELRKIDWRRLQMHEWKGAIEKALYRAGDACGMLMQNSAPYDSYDLRNGITTCMPTDPLLEEGAIMDLGTGWAE